MAEEPENKGGAIKSPQDFIGGIALLALTVVAYVAMSKLGSMRGFSFGAGTVPRLFCLLLGLLSVLIIVSSFTTAGRSWKTFPGGARSSSWRRSSSSDCPSALSALRSRA